jgi:hypothetical protein
MNRKLLTFSFLAVCTFVFSSASPGWSAGLFDQTFCGGWDASMANENGQSNEFRLTPPSGGTNSSGNAFAGTSPSTPCSAETASADGTYTWSVVHGNVNMTKAGSGVPGNLGTEHGNFTFTPNGGSPDNGQFNGRILVYNQAALDNCTSPANNNCSATATMGCTMTTAYESFGRYHLSDPSQSPPVDTGWYGTLVVSNTGCPNSSDNGCCYQADLSPNGPPAAAPTP